MTIIENDIVKLIPLEEAHFNLLLPISKQLDIHRYGPADISTESKLLAYIRSAIDDQQALPFLIIDKRTDSVAGSTRFGYIDRKHKVLHIGWTWIGPDFQGTGLNSHMKYLMLEHAFENMAMEKVEFRVDERNIRSRKAVEKLGATLEGILRKVVIVKDGFRRSSCCYGILKEEWPSIKRQLQSSIKKKRG